MDELLNSLVRLAINHKASDIHFFLKLDRLEIQFRNINGMEKIRQDIWNKELFEYMKFIAGFDSISPFS